MQHFGFGGTLHGVADAGGHGAFSQRWQERVGALRPCAEGGEHRGHSGLIAHAMQANDAERGAEHVKNGAVIEPFDHAAAALEDGAAAQDDLVLGDECLLAERFRGLAEVHFDKDLSTGPSPAWFAVSGVFEDFDRIGGNVEVRRELECFCGDAFGFHIAHAQQEAQVHRSLDKLGVSLGRRWGGSRSGGCV